jgi:hypothetical protein
MGPRPEPLWSLLERVDRVERTPAAEWRVRAGHREATGPRLREAVYEALGIVVEKRCHGCQRMHALCYFNRNEKYRDGLDVRCRECESCRKKGDRMKKKAKAA